MYGIKEDGLLDFLLNDLNININIDNINLRPIYNLRFADEIDLLAGSEAELQSLTDTLEKAATSFGMEISHIKSKTLVSA